MQVIDWTKIVGYVAGKAPAIVASLRGVSRRDIEASQQRYGVRFPASYAEFLALMGEDSGQLEPLGATQSHRFSDLMRYFPPQGYPWKRLFKVSYETNTNALVFMGKFLDWMDADADDARVVEFEQGDANAAVLPGDLTFGETVVKEIFTGLEVYVTRYASTVSIESQSAAHDLEIKSAAVDLLVRLGFTLVMPDLPRVACLNRGSISVMVIPYRSLRAITVSIGGATLLELEEFVADLTAQLPGADVLQPPFEQVE